jgi:hypothetical protein
MGVENISLNQLVLWLLVNWIECRGRGGEGLRKSRWETIEEVRASGPGQA